jgi:Ca-activated chloride channel homolog
MLLSLLLIPLCVWLYLRLQRRRRRLAASYGAFGLMQAAAGGELGWRRHLPPLLFLAGLTVLLMAMARPQTAISLPKQEGTVILVLDVSGSMAAGDAALPPSAAESLPESGEGAAPPEAEPTRMEAAKAIAREFVQRQPNSVQIGAVAFSDGGLAVQAPTDDQEAVLATINRLSPQRGTSVGHGILVALNTIVVSAGQAPLLDSNLTPVATPPNPSEDTTTGEGSSTETYESAIIVLLSDGENNESPDPFEAAQVAANMGVRIYTIGVGSVAGTTLEVEGFSVHTQLDEAALQQIAQLAEGAYYNAQNEEDLKTIYENLDPQLVLKEEKMEVTSLFAGAGILVFLIGGVFSLMWFSRLP